MSAALSCQNWMYVSNLDRSPCQPFRENFTMKQIPEVVIRASLSLLSLQFSCLAAAAQEFEREPVEYSRRQPENRVSRLMADLQSGQRTLKHEPHFGYLRSLLAQLDVPQSSQTLVFSKTSLQRQRISPAAPRALYFSDDT